MDKFKVSSLVLSLMMVTTSVAEADVQVKSLSSTAAKKSFYRGIMLGICVDQALSAQGITLKLPVAGQAYTLDDATKTAVSSAVTQCRATLSGASASTTSSSSSTAPSTSTPAATVVMPAAAAGPTTSTDGAAAGLTTL